MPKANEVAIELRKLADALDTNPEIAIPRPYISFSCRYGDETAKPMFLALVKMLPRPLKKYIEYLTSDMYVTHANNSIEITTDIERTKVCRMVEPARDAVFECEPLLSVEEEDSLV